MKKWAIIVAGGSGLRMGKALPKQFLLLADRPLLLYTIEAFVAAYDDIQIVLVLPDDFLSMGEQLIRSHFAEKNILLTVGGATRFDSVKKGLALTEREGIVFVHDGVRCLVTPSLIRRCFEQASLSGAVIPAIAAKDSIRLRTTGDKTTATTTVLDRDQVLLVQTPQTFFADWLHDAFDRPYQTQFTDEATVLEQAGKTVVVIEGEETNIKITRPVDLLIAEQYLAQRSAE
ncbi:MAG: 2-C-methyl-D-erythritol 4-phosphate cytidylyltransferase [Sphingomonadales bacterium]|nr:2-C-methyl-D-erythritol 4-phosphate cytidylyltransferase [Sphingomonadales bacterium]